MEELSTFEKINEIYSILEVKDVKKKRRRYIIFTICSIIIILLGLVSASVFVYFNEYIDMINFIDILPSITSKLLNNGILIVQSPPSFSIVQTGSFWKVYDATGDYDTYIADASDKKTHIGWYDKDGLNINTSDKLLYDCTTGLPIKDDKNKDITLKYETNKVPNPDEPDGYSDGYFIRLTDASSVNINDCVTINPTVVYQNESMVQFIEGDLWVNNTLRKWNGEEFVVAPEDIWIRTPENETQNFKFGANDTIATEDSNYQYEWISNKEIKYDEQKNYYYFDEYKSEENQISNIYSRRNLDISDICNSFLNETNDTFEPNCVFDLSHNYTYDGNFTSSTLLINFTGFYNETLGMIFIDPSYSYTNVSEEATLVTNIRSEAPFSHLSTAINESLVLYMPFDHNESSGNVYDYTNNDNDGIMYNFADNLTRTGYIGGGYEFDGSDDYVMGVSGSKLNGDGMYYTVSAWIKTNQNDIGIVEKKDNSTFETYRLSIDSTTSCASAGEIEFVYEKENNPQEVCGNVVNDNEWHHVVGVRNDTEIRIYVDGIIKDTTTGTTSGDASTTSAVDIGVRRKDTRTLDDYFNGSIDEVMIFNRSLSATEIEQLYNYTFQKFYKDGNQTFNLTEVSLGGNNRVNVTVKAQVFNDSKLSARVYEADLSEGANAYINTDVTTDNSLVGYWHFDNWTSYGENFTHVYDFSGNGNNGTWNGAQNTTCTAKYGEEAGCFNGVDDYADVGNDASLDVTSAFTLSSWIKTSGAVSDGVVLSKYDNTHDGSSYMLWFSGTANTIRFYTSDGVSHNLESNVGVRDDTWHHIVGTFNGSTKMLYVDGVLDNTGSDGVPTSEVSTRVIIGYDDANSKEPFNGSIDEVMIFNRSLSAQEVKDLYVSGSVNHTNNGVGINWTESSTGVQELTAINSTHRNATFVVNTATEWLLPEVEFNSTNGFYSSIVEDLGFVTFEVSGADTTKPTWSGNQTNQTIAGELTIFAVLLNDETALHTNGGYIFSTNNTGVWANDSLVMFSSTPEWANVTKTLPANVGNRTDWYVWFNDTAGNVNSTDVFRVVTTSAPVDTTPPTFVTIPANVSGTYGIVDVSSQFVATDETSFSMYFINDTSNFTMTNATGTITNNSGLFVGNYALNVTINDSSNNINWTIFTIIVNKAIPAGSLSGTTSITYGTVGDVEGSESNSGDSDLSYLLYRNGTSVSNPDTSTLAVGFYSYIYNTTAGYNYTVNASMDNFNLTINQDSTNCQVLFNETSPLTEGETFTTYSDCTSAFVLRRNGTIIANNSEQSLSAGTYNFSVTRNDTQNYSNIYDDENFIINVGADTTPPTFDNLANQTADVNSSFTYDIDATDSSGVSCFTVNDSDFIIDCDGVLQNASALNIQVYALNISVNDTLNNTNYGVMYINATIQDTDTILKWDWSALMTDFFLPNQICFQLRDRDFCIDDITLTINTVLRRVGIGTTTPQNTLNVVGDTNTTGISYSGNFTLSNGGAVWGNATCTFISSPDSSTRQEICNG